MYKTYVQCLVNLSNFEAENAEAMAAYNAEVEAVKEAVGDGYLDSVEYMKAEFDAALLELDTEEQERLDATAGYK